MSQSEVARALGVTPSTVHRWERATDGPDVTVIRALAELYGVSPAWLAFGLEQGPPRDQLGRADEGEGQEPRTGRRGR